MLLFGENKKKLHPVSAVVCIYDCVRLVFLLALIAIFFNPEFKFRVINLPLLMFAAPNALFPLMSFFLIIRFQESRNFIPLYITGKALCLLCVIIWMVFTSGQISNNREILPAVFLCAADLATIMGTAMLNEERAPENTIPETSEGGE